jgi:hypothetical protein
MFACAGRPENAVRLGSGLAVLAVIDAPEEPQVAQFDLCIRGGTIATASDPISCQYRHSQSRIVSIADRIERREIDATGLLALPALIVTSRFCSGQGAMS